jgi:hypothetical protein
MLCGLCGPHLANAAFVSPDEGIAAQTARVVLVRVLYIVRYGPEPSEVRYRVQ